MTEDTSIITNSICKSCCYRICRTIIPPDYYWEEMGEEFEDEEDEDDREDQIVEHNYCLVLEIPLDHVVMGCNKFEPTQSKTLLKNEGVLRA